MSTPDFPPPGPAEPGAGYPPPPGGQAGGYGAAQGYGAPTGYGAPGQQGGYGMPPAYAEQGGRPPLAPWWRRVVGALIDGAISAAVANGLASADPALGQVAGLLMTAVFGALVGLRGWTPGKRAMGIRVLRERDGQVLGVGLGIGRAFLHILDVLSLGLGYLWPLWDAKKQTFADKVVSSVAVRG